MQPLSKECLELMRLKALNEGLPPVKRTMYFCGLRDALEDKSLLSAAGLGVMEWIPISPESMPTKLERVEAIVENDKYGGGKIRQITIAEYVPYKEVPENEYMEDQYQGDGDYDEEKDEYFTPAGFYEMNLCEDTHWKIHGIVTHYKPLSALPKPPITIKP